jgi:hypothetical protein
MLLVRFGPAQRAWVVPRGRNFDKDAPLQDEVHIAGDKSSIAYRKALAALGLGRSFTT